MSWNWRSKVANGKEWAVTTYTAPNEPRLIWSNGWRHYHDGWTISANNSEELLPTTWELI